MQQAVDVKKPQEIVGTIPALCRQATECAGMVRAGIIDLSRIIMRVVEGERWRDPARYGRDVDDPVYGYQAMKDLSADELCERLCGQRYRTIRALYDAAQIVPSHLLAEGKITLKALEVLAQYPDALPAAVELAQDHTVGEEEARTLVRPLHYRPRLAPPVTASERESWERRLAEVQRAASLAAKELRQEREARKQAEAAVKEMQEELRSARDQIADMQSRLYGGK